MSVKLLKVFKIILFSLSLMDAKVIFNFSENASLQNWRVIDDGVMGGVSKGSLRTNYEGHGVFSGFISLDNYGGFSSIRYNTNAIDVRRYKYISILAFGDNKEYQLRIKSDYYDRHVYSKSFFVKNEWQEILVPLSEMKPQFRGRLLRMAKFNDESIVEVGILIGNKVEENFTLFIDNISLK